MDLAGILAGAKEMGGDAKAGFYAGNMTGRVQPDMPPSPLLAALMGMLPGSDQGSAPAIMHELDPSTAYMGGRTAGAGAHGAREMTRGLAEALAPENVGSMVGGAVGNVESMMEGDGSRLGFDTSRAMDDGVEAVMSKLMGVGDALKGGFQEGRSAANPSAGALGTPQTVEEVEAQIQRLMQQRAQMMPGGAPAPQAAGAAEGGGANEAGLLLDQAMQAGKGALGGAKDAIGGMAGNVMDSMSAPLAPWTGGAEQQAIGGMDPTTIQHLQQILSPQELQAVMQDPVKMAEIKALMEQQGLMGGQ